MASISNGMTSFNKVSDNAIHGWTQGVAAGDDCHPKVFKNSSLMLALIINIF